MPYITDHKQKFDDLQSHINNQDQLKRQANGGNSILFIYQPDEEQFYIQKAKALYHGKAAFIDISKLLVDLKTPSWATGQKWSQKSKKG